MIQEFKSVDGFANCYVISRFHECVIINPAHSYEEVIKYIDSKVIKGIFVTEVTKQTIDQIGYYQSPIYLSVEQKNSLDDSIPGYNSLREIPFKKDQLKILIYDNLFELEIADNKLVTHVIEGVDTPTTVIQFANNLIVGNLFINGKICKKASYKSSIYDLKKSILELMNLRGNYNLHHSFRVKNTFSNEKLNNTFINRWLE